MPQFTCTSCNAGFYSAATLADLNNDICAQCGSLLVTTAAPDTPADRLGHLIARREVARAQARIDAEHLAGAF
jgi:hypothetical protein